ncbi:hypothetical protein FEF26_00280 [Nesterenkonia salmonea]|uniref:Uncharacterized protein n=1 Tax=Nesterenkonia salmonea TaxID=1804987 RepID=A0A5R9BLN7_9MICC|nr:hypothetical protein [Nesterenkonia salmonea]TLQ01455.1 hypothetical protein FEF26_00280 [Nesterenkonia salmonea]
MPDKPLETTWMGTRVLPAVRRAKRVGRRLGRRARSVVAPRIGALGQLRLNAPTTDLTSAEAKPEWVRRCGVVVARIPDQARIPRSWREVLIEAERHSVPTVLVVGSENDLDHPLAAVVTHLVTTDPLVLTAVQNFAGTERAGLIDAAAGKREQMSALFALTRLHTPLEKT